MLTAVHLLGQQNTLADNQHKHFSIEQSGQFMIHSSIQLILVKKDYLSVNVFVADKKKKCRCFFVPKEVIVQDPFRMLTHTLVMP